MARDKMKFEDAKLMVVKMVIGARIPGLGSNRLDLNDTAWRRRYLQDAKTVLRDSQDFEWEQAWAVNCNLRIRWTDEAKNILGKTAECKCSVSWSSSGRDLGDSRACVALYSKVLDLACLIEAHMAGHYIESISDSYDRVHQESLKRKMAEFRYGQFFDLTFKKRKKHAHGGSYSTTGIPYDLVPDAVHKAEGHTVKCGCCKNKAKLLIWHSPEKGFLLRCNRHRDRVPPPPSLEGIAPDPCKKEADAA